MSSGVGGLRAPPKPPVRAGRYIARAVPPVRAGRYIARAVPPVRAGRYIPRAVPPARAGCRVTRAFFALRDADQRDVRGVGGAHQSFAIERDDPPRLDGEHRGAPGDRNLDRLQPHGGDVEAIVVLVG